MSSSTFWPHLVHACIIDRILSTLGQSRPVRPRLEIGYSLGGFSTSRFTPLALSSVVLETAWESAHFSSPRGDPSLLTFYRCLDLVSKWATVLPEHFYPEGKSTQFPVFRLQVLPILPVGENHVQLILWSDLSSHVAHSLAIPSSDPGESKLFVWQFFLHLKPGDTL